MTEFLLCRVEKMFSISGRGVVVTSPEFPVSAYCLEARQRIRIVQPGGEKIECRAEFQIPRLSPQPKDPSFWCLLRNVAPFQVPADSELWLLDRNEADVKVAGGLPPRLARVRPTRSRRATAPASAPACCRTTPGKRG